MWQYLIKTYNRENKVPENEINIKILVKLSMEQDVHVKYHPLQ